MIRINLLPPEYEAAQRKKEQQIIFGGTAGVIVVILGLFWAAKRSKLANLTEEIQKSQTTLNTYQAVISQIEQIEQDKKRLSEKRDVIRELNRSRLIYPVFFEDFLPIVPSDVWITSLQFTEQGNQMLINLNCNATSNFAVATWLTNLQQSTHFSNVELGPIAYSKSETAGTTLSFTLNFQYRHQGPFPLADF